MDRKNLPIFMHDAKTFEILKKVKSAIPKNTEVYLVGGSIRNSVYFKIFNSVLPQRDYDLVLIGNKKTFIENIRKLGFVYGRIRRKREIVLKMKKTSSPKDYFKDYVFLDIHLSDEKSILKNIRENANFTINGFALSLRYVTSSNWYDKLVHLPNSKTDLRKKKLRVNASSYPSTLFSCLRFMSLGFEAPNKKDVKKLYEALKFLRRERHKRNVKKLFDYVEGEVKARKLLKRIGIKEDIFDFNTLKNSFRQG